MVGLNDMGDDSICNDVGSVGDTLPELSRVGGCGCGEVTVAAKRDSEYSSELDMKGGGGGGGMDDSKSNR